MRLAGPVSALLAAAAAFAGGRAVLWAAARRDRIYIFDPESWVRFDSHHYLTIAQQGYAFAPCGEGAAYAAHDWCGNTGWLPGFPLLVRALIATGLPAALSGVILAALFHLLTLGLAWRLGGDQPWPRRAAMLAAVALAPGQVYQHAVFPVSLFCVLALASLEAAQRARWTAAGLLGAGAAFSYSTGFLLAPVLAAIALIVQRGDARGAMRGAALSAGLTAAGFAAVLLLHWAAVGDPLAFFKVQAKYGHGLHAPWEPLFQAVTAVAADARDWIAWQTIVVAVLMIALAVAVAARRFRPAGLDRALVVFAAAYWLFPLTVGGRLSLYRADALLLPAVVLLRRAPWPVTAGLAIGLAYLDYKMGIRFFRGVLV